MRRSEGSRAKSSSTSSSRRRRRRRRRRKRSSSSRGGGGRKSRSQAQLFPLGFARLARQSHSTRRGGGSSSGSRSQTREPSKTDPLATRAGLTAVSTPNKSRAHVDVQPRPALGAPEFGARLAAHARGPVGRRTGPTAGVFALCWLRRGLASAARVFAADCVGARLAAHAWSCWETNRTDR